MVAHILKLFTAVYAVFYATIRIIDVAKRDALRAQLLANETLDEKFGALTLKTGIARTRE